MSAVFVQRQSASPSPSPASEFLFGDPVMHGRFSTAIEILAQMVVATPRAVSGASLADALGQPVRAIRTLLRSLHGAGLIGQDAHVKDLWFCSGPLHAITLADVFRCICLVNLDTAAAPEGGDAAAPDSPARSANQQSVDLLLMQATMAVNQVVLQHLQQFDLGRLRAVSTSSALHVFKPALRSYGMEPC
ncbi:MAG: hypothetical protein H7315_09180 [Herminiimonas sp.]|nr:hypothetical protein [Herminiimonas sp.]